MAVTPRATDPDDLGIEPNTVLTFPERTIATGYWLWAVDQPTFIP